jgi:hypothetical protein
MEICGRGGRMLAARVEQKNGMTEDYKKRRDALDKESPIQAGCGRSACPVIAMIAVSPFSTGGYITHSYTEHSSFVKFVERNWKLGTLTARSRDNLPNPKMNNGNPYVPMNMPAIGDLFDMFNFTKTNAYSGNNGRAAILNNTNGANVLYTAGNAGNGANPQPNGVIIGAGAQILSAQTKALVAASAASTSRNLATSSAPWSPFPLTTFRLTRKATSEFRELRPPSASARHHSR